MKKLRIYLDTSVINFLFADDAPEKRDITRRFFACHLRSYDAVVSEIVLFELRKTRDPRKRAMLVEAVEQHAIGLLDIAVSKRAEIERLADAYQHHRLFPAVKREDALHVALCTIFEFDALVSWNYRHLANIKKQVLINTINDQRGYHKELHLLTPYEMIDEDEN